MQGILAQRKQSSGHDDDDDDEAETPEPPPTNPAATAAKKPVRKKLCKNGPLKRPAAAQSPTKASPHAHLAFPGTKHRPPLVYGNSKVYFGKGQYRLMECIGDRYDVAYSFKAKDPKEVWKDLAKRLRELNP